MHLAKPAPEKNSVPIGGSSYQRRDQRNGASSTTPEPFPFAAFMLFLADILVIYGLVVYGGGSRTTT